MCFGLRATITDSWFGTSWLKIYPSAVLDNKIRCLSYSPWFSQYLLLYLLQLLLSSGSGIRIVLLEEQICELIENTSHIVLKILIVVHCWFSWCLSTFDELIIFLLLLDSLLLSLLHLTTLSHQLLMLLRGCLFLNWLWFSFDHVNLLVCFKLL